MRVTQSMLSNNMLKNLSNSYNRLAKLQDQISTQRKFTKPSDDPVAAMMGMNYRSDVNSIEQYQRNIGEVTNWVDSTDDALNNAVLALQRIRELTVQASNGTYEGDQRQAIAKEIEQLKEQLVDIGDTQVGGKYIFNGKDTNLRPSENGFSTGEVKFEVFHGISLQANIEGGALFEAAGSTVQDLYDSLMNDDSHIGDHLETIDDTIDQFLAARSVIGAKQNRVEMMDERLSSQEVFAQQILSKNEDIDIEKAITELITQESVHSAALSIGTKIIQPTLVDFLR
nr:flagellar hook-associated protein FlgL [uncultured Bacillus sp.]